MTDQNRFIFMKQFCLAMQDMNICKLVMVEFYVKSNENGFFNKCTYLNVPKYQSVTQIFLSETKLKLWQGCFEL